MTESNAELKPVLDLINTKFDQIDQRFDKMDQRFNGLESELREFRLETGKNFELVHKDIVRLDEKIGDKADTLNSCIEAKEENLKTADKGLDRRLVIQERLNYGVLGAFLLSVILNAIKIFS